MSVTEVTLQTFEREVLRSDKPVLADFKAEWCGPCRALKRTIHELAEQNDRIKVVSIDVDAEGELADEYDITSIPCLVLFRNGAEAARSVGLRSRDEIEDMIGED